MPPRPTCSAARAVDDRRPGHRRHLLPGPVRGSPSRCHRGGLDRRRPRRRSARLPRARRPANAVSRSASQRGRLRGLPDAPLGRVDHLAADRIRPQRVDRQRTRTGIHGRARQRRGRVLQPVRGAQQQRVSTVRSAQLASPRFLARLGGAAPGSPVSSAGPRLRRGCRRTVGRLGPDVDSGRTAVRNSSAPGSRRRQSARRRGHHDRMTAGAAWPTSGPRARDDLDVALHGLRWPTRPSARSRDSRSPIRRVRSSWSPAAGCTSAAYRVPSPRTRRRRGMSMAWPARPRTGRSSPPRSRHSRRDTASTCPDTAGRIRRRAGATPCRATPTSSRERSPRSAAARAPARQLARRLCRDPARGAAARSGAQPHVDLARPCRTSG